MSVNVITEVLLTQHIIQEPLSSDTHQRIFIRIDNWVHKKIFRPVDCITYNIEKKERNKNKNIETRKEKEKKKKVFAVCSSLGTLVL